MAQPEAPEYFLLHSRTPRDTESWRLLWREKVETAGGEEVIYEDILGFNWVLLNQNQTNSLHGDSQEAAWKGGEIWIWKAQKPIAVVLSSS